MYLRLVVPIGPPSRGVLQLLERRGGGDGRALHRHERPVHVVVPLAEVHALRAFRQVRDLLEPEVEALRTRGERLVEADLDEPDPVLGEPESIGCLERHRALIAPT